LRRRFHALLLALVLGVMAVGYLARIDLWPNDAGYVYFTYARNFVAGRPFAYDQRGLRSEGVPSPLLLLMLVPFEWLGVNPYLAALLLSWLGAALSVGLWTATLRQGLARERLARRRRGGHAPPDARGRERRLSRHGRPRDDLVSGVRPARDPARVALAEPRRSLAAVSWRASPGRAEPPQPAARSTCSAESSGVVIMVVTNAIRTNIE
jgi:hypothetical protein